MAAYFQTMELDVHEGQVAGQVSTRSLQYAKNGGALARGELIRGLFALM